METRAKQRNSGDQAGEQDNRHPNEAGQYRNVETAVNNPSYFGDDYATEQEAEMGREEAAAEDENNRRPADS